MLTCGVLAIVAFATEHSMVGVVAAAIMFVAPELARVLRRRER
jgi:hypothetical protein